MLFMVWYRPVDTVEHIAAFLILLIIELQPFMRIFDYLRMLQLSYV